MKFEIGKCYQHATGKKMRIIAEIETCFYGHCLLGETDDGYLKPVGKGESHFENWQECEDFANQVLDEAT